MVEAVTHRPIALGLALIFTELKRGGTECVEHVEVDTCCRNKDITETDGE